MNIAVAQSGFVCAFCRKPLPIVDGRIQPWRSPSGQFFCNEFCADDAEEARFQRHLRGTAPAAKFKVEVSEA